MHNCWTVLVAAMGVHKMRRAILVTVAALAALTTGGARADAASAGGLHYYLALGDSLARSAQPNRDFQHGYAEQLLALLQQQDSSLRLVKLGCGGATTTDMIYGSSDPSCAFPHKTQLAEAVAFLQAHRRSVSLVTIDIGANDLPDVIGDPNQFPWIRQIDLNGDGRICADLVPPPDRTLILLDNPNVIAR